MHLELDCEQRALDSELAGGELERTPDRLQRYSASVATEKAQLKQVEKREREGSVRVAVNLDRGSSRRTAP
jgi:hypothetical protein